MGKRGLASLMAASVLLVIMGCAKPTQPHAVDEPPAPVVDPPPVETPPVVTPPPRPDWDQPITDENFADRVAKFQPNELGRVLILEYHHFGDEEDRWTRQWENFRKDLETLYAKGYRAVNLLDYLNDTMKLPAGTSPVIFTFDDSIPTQFRMVQKDGKWELDPQTAVGIMMDFKKQHPDFGMAGTFYVNFTPVPFGEEAWWKEGIRFLADNGFEVANHSVYHDNLGDLSNEEVRRSLGDQVKRLREVLPGYDGSTLALPFGIWPNARELAVTGEWEGVRYHHRAVLLVGADPVLSPYDRRLDVLALPRVQAIDEEFARWYPFLDAHRYISDGDPNSVTFPESERANLNDAAVKGKTVRAYPLPEG